MNSFNNQQDNKTALTGDEAADLKFKFNIGTEELREIVGRLNKKPFEMNFTLVSFDELQQMESLELVNKIFVELDKKHDVVIKTEGSEKTLDRFCEFMRILSYPGKFDDEIVRRFLNGEKKLKKRAYLGKFLVPILIPDEYMADDEMKKNHADYTALIAEFKENHKIYDEKSKGASDPQTLKKEISSLENEKDQLNNKIKEFQEKYNDKADFTALLKEISGMRKEQEEDSTLKEKLLYQKKLLDRSDSDLLMAQQKLIDSKRAIHDDATAEEMLYALKSEVARIKNKISEIQFDIKDKRKKLAENEEKIYDPLPPPDQVDGMKNKLSNLRNVVADLTRRLVQEKDPEKEENLFIQRKQEQKVKAQKDDTEKEMKRLEEERNDLDEKIRDRTKELEKIKGPGYSKKTDIGKYQEKYQQKKSKQMKMERELNELKTENGTLKETLSILHQEKGRTDMRVSDYEKRYGVEGLASWKFGINNAVEEKENIDVMKGKTLEEMSAIVQKLNETIESLKGEIQPLVQDHKYLKTQKQDLDQKYIEEKAKFDSVTSDAKNNLDKARDKYLHEKNEVYSYDTKIDILKHQIEVIKSFQEMLNRETEYQEGKKVLNNQHKSYANWMKSELSNYDSVKADLKQKRDHIKKHYDASINQMDYLKQMEFLLSQKLSFKKRGGGIGGVLKGTEHHEGKADVLIMNN